LTLIVRGGGMFSLDVAVLKARPPHNPAKSEKP
jgi:hypothetical protein